MSEHALRKGKRRWIEKTPNNVFLLDLIEDVFAGSAQYIFVIRHPLDCVASLAEFFPFPENHEDPDVARNHAKYGFGHVAWAKYWLETSERIRLFSRSVPDRHILVRYEDLVTHPMKEMKQLLCFLGEVTPPNILEQAFELPHDRGYEDYKILLSSGIHDRSIGRWRSWPPEYALKIWRTVETAAISFGYSLGTDSLETPPALKAERPD